MKTQWIMRPLRWVGIGSLLVAAYWLGSRGSDGPASSEPQSRPTALPDSSDEQEAETIWTCLMHPHIRLSRPGKCPICAMELIPVSQAAGARTEHRVLTMSEDEKRLAEIVTVPVRHQYVETEVRMFGKVETDETRL